VILLEFSNFTDKKAVLVGAGGSRLGECVRPARRMIAVDEDAR
jgi:hypothetical protein